MGAKRIFPAKFLKLLTLACAFLSPLGLHSEANDSVKAIKLGTRIYGAPVEPKTLEGKVVLMEFWGLACPPCKKGFPHLISLARKHKDKPFHLIASNWQGGFKTADFMAFLKDECNMEENEPALSVVDQGSHPGITPKGIPHWGVFNHKGVLVKTAHGAVDDALIESLILEAEKEQADDK
ncbi:MAG: TlpA family protein disulfide reductase [Planctomycetota bacterium]